MIQLQAKSQAAQGPLKIFLIRAKGDLPGKANEAGLWRRPEPRGEWRPGTKDSGVLMDSQ